MASEVGICNRALQKLGAKRITSLSQDTSNARACNAAYTDVRDQLYEDHEWGFTILRVQLPADSTAPVFNRDNAYTLPSDFIRLAAPDPEDNDPDKDWLVENGKILTNDSAPLNVKYVSRVTDPNLMPPLFQKALSAELAFELCDEITQSNTKKESLRTDADAALARAKRSNAIQKPAQQLPEDDWVSARR